MPRDSKALLPKRIRTSPLAEARRGPMLSWGSSLLDRRFARSSRLPGIDRSAVLPSRAERAGFGTFHQDLSSDSPDDSDVPPEIHPTGSEQACDTDPTPEDRTGLSFRGSPPGNRSPRRPHPSGTRKSPPR
jgi:hypothetical protein